MREIVDALAQQHAELAGLLDGLDEAGWRQASPCDGWDVAAVVLHLAQSDEIALASVQGRFSEFVEALGASDAAPGSTVDEGVERLVAGERASSPAEIHDRWSRGASAMRAELLHSDPHTRVRWVVGDMAARTLATTRLAETWIHTRDVAVALEVDLEPTDRIWHIARLAWRTLPHAFARDDRAPPGPVAFRLAGPDGAPWDFSPDGDVPTEITGDALELCLVAARRVPSDATSLRGDGPDADTVLELVRTWA
ncbi:MAG TPA: maleylpyruvate isomerase family mycothiol-dependent enzyme [Acidimicrobiia bacterium]|nr:maleylpyruvate isomerase family mycothiol-dependent enzyme [Acidimicrobiia bacterium]